MTEGDIDSIIYITTRVTLQTHFHPVHQRVEATFSLSPVCLQ